MQIAHTRPGGCTYLLERATQESLLLLLSELTTRVEALPDNIFDDEPRRKKVQTQVAGIKAVVDTPIEAVLEIFLQVCLCMTSLTL